MGRQSNPNNFDTTRLHAIAQKRKTERLELMRQAKDEVDRKMAMIEREFLIETATARNHGVSISMIAEVVGKNRNQVYEILKQSEDLVNIGAVRDMIAGDEMFTVLTLFDGTPWGVEMSVQKPVKFRKKTVKPGDVARGMFCVLPSGKPLFGTQFGMEKFHSLAERSDFKHVGEFSDIFQGVNDNAEETSDLRDYFYQWAMKQTGLAENQDEGYERFQRAQKEGMA